MKKNKKYESDLSKKLKLWETQMHGIRSKSDSVPAQYLLEFERQLDLLFAKHNLAEEKLKQLKKATGGEYEDLKASLDGICREIENALDSAEAKID